MRRDKRAERDIARDRVQTLVSLARDALRSGRADRAHRYAELAWRVKTTYQLRGSAIDGRICRACHAFLLPGATSRVRLSAGKRVVTCLRCGAMRRTPLHGGTRGKAGERNGGTRGKAGNAGERNGGTRGKAGNAGNSTA